MTVLTGAPPPPPPSGPGRLVWYQVPRTSDALGCGHLHGRAPGHLDETARRLSHEELAVARLLAAEGHDVRSLAESRRGGRRPDLLVCGTPLEIKSFAPVAERRRAPTPYSVLNKLLDASGQARHAVLLGTGSGLSESTVRRGVARYVSDRGPARALSTLRIVGDGYDLTWTRRRSLQLPGGLGSPPGRRPPGPGLGL